MFTSLLKIHYDKLFFSKFLNEAYMSYLSVRLFVICFTILFFKMVVQFLPKEWNSQRQFVFCFINQVAGKAGPYTYSLRKASAH